VTAVALPAIASLRSFPAADAGAPPSNGPLQVDIVRAPENGSDWDLAFATWGLAGATILLCVITGVGVRRQGKDMERSLKAAETSAAAAGKSAAAAADAVEAAARQRREDLEREVHSVAHTVIATAASVSELAKEAPMAARTLFGLAGRSPLAALAAPYDRVMQMRQEAANEASTAAGILLATLDGKPPDGELTAGLRDMDRRLVVVELMKEDVTRQTENLNSQIASQREQNENRRQRASGKFPPPDLSLP
jgi:hypothetical protein